MLDLFPISSWLHPSSGIPSVLGQYTPSFSTHHSTLSIGQCPSHSTSDKGPFLVPIAVAEPATELVTNKAIPVTTQQLTTPSPSHSLTHFSVL